MLQLQDFISWVKTQYNSYESNFFHCALFLVAGITTGMILRAYGRFLFILLCALGATLFFLHATHIITLNHALIDYYLDIHKTVTLEESFSLATTWIQTHLALSSAACVGFFLGWKFE